jgi:hypothetical protein
MSSPLLLPAHQRLVEPSERLQPCAHNFGNDARSSARRRLPSPKKPVHVHGSHSACWISFSRTLSTVDGWPPIPRQFSLQAFDLSWRIGKQIVFPLTPSKTSTESVLKIEPWSCDGCACKYTYAWPSESSPWIGQFLPNPPIWDPERVRHSLVWKCGGMSWQCHPWPQAYS